MPRNNGFTTPFGGMDALSGWQALDMNEIAALVRFARENSEIQAVFEVCYNSLLSGDIMIEPAGDGGEDGEGEGGTSKKRKRPAAQTKKPAAGPKRKKIKASFDDDDADSSSEDSDDDGERKKGKLEREDPWEEIKRRKRSAIFGAWAWKCAVMEDAIGFAPTTVVPNEDPITADDVPYVPVVLNVEKIKIFHRTDVYDRHYWRFYEIEDKWSGLQSRPFPYLKEITQVTVLGEKSLPDSNGALHSKVKRLMLGLWSLYQAKVLNTMRADKERSRPTLVTYAADDGGSGGGGGGGGDDKNVSGAAVRGFNQMTPARNELSEQAERVHALVKAKNSGDHCLQNMLENSTLTLTQAHQQAASGGGARTFEQFQLDAGRLYVPSHLPEAPVELLPIRQAFLETVCLTFGIPLSMVSSGDATGRVKLNSETASPETARIFREAQADRKRRVETHIGNFYENIYGDEQVHRYVRDRVRGAVDRGDEDEDDGDEQQQPKRKTQGRRKVDIPVRDMARHAKVTVQIPANPQFEQLMMLFDKRILKYDAFCKVVGNQMCLSQDSFNEEEPPSELDQKMKEAEAMLDIKKEEGKLKLSMMVRESELKMKNQQAESAVSLETKKAESKVSVQTKQAESKVSLQTKQAESKVKIKTKKAEAAAKPKPAAAAAAKKK
jgi:hypothetical protein